MKVRIQLLVCALSLMTVTSSNACPIGCTCAEHRVRCYGMQLTEIPENISPDTTHLDLESNQIDVIDPQRISHLTELTELMLGYNNVVELQPGAFNAQTKLTLLNMNSNKLTSIPAGAFDGLHNLTSLYLTNNKIKTVAGAFQNLTRLKRMDIGGNVIEELTEVTFKDLKNLVYLMMPDNNINSVADTTFVPLQSLSHLVMSNNPLNRVSNLYSRNHRLSYIDLSGCGITEIPTGLPWATRHLQLGKNNITRIKKVAFYGTHYLEILILDENKITRIDKKAFVQAKNLDQLWLNDNLLKKIPSLLPTKLTKLYMGKNRIAKLSPKDFPKNSALTELVLNSNQITNIATNAFRQTKFLKILNLKSNKLTLLQSDLFASLGKLETLSLNNNKFTTMEDGTFNGLASLQKLEMAFIMDINTDVQGNLFAATPSLQTLDIQLSPSIAGQILESDAMMSCLGNLTSLNMMDNELTMLSLNLQTYLPNVRVVKLAGNRWHCDKRLQWLSAWVRSKEIEFLMKDNIQCHTPKPIKGLPIWLLKADKFAPTTVTVAARTTTTPVPPTLTARPELKATNRPTRIVVTRERLVTRTQRFFVFPSTTQKFPSTTQKTKSPRTVINNAKQSSVPTTISTKPATTTKMFKKQAYTTQMKSGSVTAISTRMVTFSTHKNSTAKPKHDHGNFKSTTTVNWTPSTNSSKDDASFADVEQGQTEAISSSGTTSMTTIIIATCVAAAVVLVIICVVIFVTVRIRQNKLVYHRALQYRQDYSDVVFFVGEPVQEHIDTKLRTTRSRSDRGSTSSRPSEDITNDLDSSMKVYTWDDK